VKSFFDALDGFYENAAPAAVVFVVVVVYFLLNENRS
jgi:hypothetical protein